MATIILKHSTVKDKLPSSAQFGEVFVNYNNENPFLATLNNQGQFEKFLSENKTKELFYTKSQVNDIIANIESGVTIEFDDYYKKNEVDTLLQGKSDIGHTHSYTALTDLPDLSGYAQKSDLDDYLTIASASTIYATKEELEEHIPTVDAYTKAETDVLLAGKANSAHTHDYETLTNKPDLSNFATKGEIPDTNGFATKQELANYMPNSGMTDYALKSEIPSIEGLATEAELANYQSISGMSEYSTTAHTHSYNDLTDKPTIPSTSGLASETWVGQNFQPQSGMSEYSTTAHTHSQYITQTSADSRYARVVSCTQAEYDALVQNDQIEQGVLYCITESNS